MVSTTIKNDIKGKSLEINMSKRRFDIELSFTVTLKITTITHIYRFLPVQLAGDVLFVEPGVVYPSGQWMQLFSNPS